jgi:hypothetical protein
MISHREEVRVVEAYLTAKKAILQSVFASEIVSGFPDPREIHEEQFLRELAWVVLSSGMAESVVRAKFPFVAIEFLGFASATAIVAQKDDCVSGALEHFGHKAKIAAIAFAAERIAHEGFASVHESVLRNPIAELQEFPFIGPVTAFHLAKNLGIRTAKPDRHLVRIAEANGFSDVQSFCHVIAAYLGEDIRRVDLVLWRYATLDNEYRSLFCRGAWA